MNHFKRFNFIIISLFGLLVIFNLFYPKEEFSSLENRYLQKIPHFSIKAVSDGTFMKQFESFSDDQLFGRDFLVKKRAQAEILLSKKENNGVYFAQDGYLIEQPPVLEQEIVMENINAVKMLHSLGRFKITLSVVPSAFEILREKLPEHVYKPVILTLNQAIQKELKDTEIQNADPSGVLWNHRNEYIYYKTDHHQTSRGSRLSYEALASFLGYEPLGDEAFHPVDVSHNFLGTTYSKGLISVKPDTITAYETHSPATVSFPEEKAESPSVYFHNHLEEKDQYAFFLDGNHGLTVVHGPNKNGRHLAIFKDSYAHSLAPFLANPFETIHLIDLRYFQGDVLEYLHNNQLQDVLFYYSASTFMTKGTLDKVTASVETSPYAHFQPYGRVEENEPVDAGYFNDAVFVGDSLTVGFQMYSNLVEAEFLSGTALSITGLGSVDAPGGGGSILDRIQNDTYKKIYIMLGINELIEPSNKVAFMEKYGTLIDTIKKTHPDAYIYIQSILPVSQSEDAKGRLRNEYIYDFDAALEEMAANKGAYYLDIASALADENGFLPEHSSVDGIHLNQEYYLKWLDYLKTHTVYDPLAAKATAAMNLTDPIVSDYDVTGIASHLKDSIAFADEMGQMSHAMLCKTHGIDPKMIANSIGFIGGGATAEEIAVVEVKKKKDAGAAKQSLEEYVQIRRKSFETYLPAEVPKLEHPFLFSKEKLIVLVIADDHNQAKEIILKAMKE